MPIAIYIISYYAFPNVSWYDGTLKGIIDINKEMYYYHSTLTDSHPFSSPWYKWPYMDMPVWYYSMDYHNGMYSTISIVGNPAIWWVGILAIIFVLIKLIIKRHKEDLFILIFYLSTYVPYIFIGRIMFLYHYFICLPFLMLAIVSMIKAINDKTKHNYIYISYIVLVFIMFVMFYPISSGMVVPIKYVDWMEWLPNWLFA